MKNEHSTTRIIHIDMDAFYAAVEVRDNPALGGKPLIVGSLPGERGVVSTCSYEARKFGVRSAMSIADAYRRCPDAIYMRPNFAKYEEASARIHEIWSDYTDLCEYVSLDEGFLDVTGTAHYLGGAANISHEIKHRTKEEVGLTCSVGVGYSMMSAKLASEEKKPDGFFEILTLQDLRSLIIDRNVRIIYGVGAKTAEELAKLGIVTVRHIYDNRQTVAALLGNHGKQILKLADGIDERKVTPHTEPKSFGNEHTFQQDITDFDYLKDVLLLIAQRLSFDVRQKTFFARTITLKVTYQGFKQITRSSTGQPINDAAGIYKTAAAMLDKIERRPIRLVGIALSGFTDTPDSPQLSLFDVGKDNHSDKLGQATLKLQQKYGRGIVKTGNVLRAEKQVGEGG